MSTSSSSPGAAGRWLVFGLLAAAQFMVILDASVITIALASIQDDLGFAADDLQWVVSAYVIPFGGLLLLGGRVADVVGRKRTFLAGLGVFTLASLAGGLAQSELWLVVARAAQGIGAAFLAPAALSLVMTMFGDGEERTKALGLWGAVSGAAGAAGVLAGGTLTEGLGWEATLLVNVPIGAALAVAVRRTVRESRRADAREGFDVAGALTVVAGVTLAIYAIVNANDAGWGSAQTLALGGLAVAVLVAFFVIEARVAAPLVDLRLLRSRTVGGASLVALVVAAALHPMFYFGGLLMQQGLGFSALGSGVAWLPMSLLVMTSAGALAPRLIGRFGSARVLAGGGLLMAAGLVVWSRAAGADGYVEGILPALLVTAPGVGLAVVGGTVTATAGVPEHQAGIVSGLVNMTNQVGAAIGLAVLVAISSSRTADALAAGSAPADALGDGFSAAFLTGAGLA
ncbi:MAG TPA: MFS transporter, partial [Capillimicrobium sp.]|nr:MFS transporter [Capillimicrobium sp.]